MATTGESERTLKELKSQIEKQKIAVQQLGLLFEQHAQDIFRSDQAALLDNLKVIILKEVEEIRDEETIASARFDNMKTRSAMTGFAISAIGAAISHQIDPLSAGFNSFSAAFNRQAPFNTILVAIGNKGLPEGVSVISLSSLARQSNRNEAQLSEGIQAHSTLLITPPVFAKLVDNLKLRIIDSSLSLPISPEQIAREIEVVTSNAKPRVLAIKQI